MLLKNAKRLIYAGTGSITILATRVLAQQNVPSDVTTNISNINPGLGTNLTEQVKNIINILIIIIGMVAVIMLVVGGFRYVFSQGNETAVQGAKDTILYAIIGIVVALLAFGIINFILAGLG